MNTIVPHIVPKANSFSIYFHPHKPIEVTNCRFYPPQNSRLKSNPTSDLTSDYLLEENLKKIARQIEETLNTKIKKELQYNRFNTPYIRLGRPFTNKCGIYAWVFNYENGLTQYFELQITTKKPPIPEDGSKPSFNTILYNDQPEPDNAEDLVPTIVDQSTASLGTEQQPRPNNPVSDDQPIHSTNRFIPAIDTQSSTEPLNERNDTTTNNNNNTNGGQTILISTPPPRENNGNNHTTTTPSQQSNRGHRDASDQDKDANILPPTNISPQKSNERPSPLHKPRKKNLGAGVAPPRSWHSKLVETKRRRLNQKTSFKPVTENQLSNQQNNTESGNSSEESKDDSVDSNQPGDEQSSSDDEEQQYNGQENTRHSSDQEMSEPNEQNDYDDNNNGDIEDNYGDFNLDEDFDDD